MTTDSVPGVGYTATQRQRLGELGLPPGAGDELFATATDRDHRFEQRHGELVAANLARLESLRTGTRRPLTRRLEATLVDTLVDAGFTEVITPILLSGEALARTGVTPDDPLHKQVFWLDGRRCLRPMLAPGLYALLARLQKLWPPPIRLFEVGPCFRRESSGSQHLAEFTMLNLVELSPQSAPPERLADLGRQVLEAVGLVAEQRVQESAVYGATVDLEVAGVEVASGVAGPHLLDAGWGIHDPWVGWGFGLERMAMLCAGATQVGRFGRSVVYLDGARLNIAGHRASTDSAGARTMS